MSTERPTPIRRQRPPEAMVYYSNDSAVSRTAWDMHLNFGQLLPPLAEGPAVVNMDVVVIMSLDHAEKFYDALGDQILRMKADRQAQQQVRGFGTAGRIIDPEAAP